MPRIARPPVLLAISVLLMLASAIGASLVQTSAGRVSVDEFALPTSGGEKLSVQAFRPASATPENPAPAVVTTHGYLNNKGMQTPAAVELARRGFVVFVVDLYHHGRSSGTTEAYLKNREFMGLGLLEAVDYVHSRLDYVDPERIGLTGHSTGGRSVSYVLDAYGRAERARAGEELPRDADAPPRSSTYETAVKSALIVANVPAPYLLDSIPEGIDVGILLSQYDEGAPMQMTKVDGYPWPDVTVSPQIKNFINLAQPGTFALEREDGVDPATGGPLTTFSGWDTAETVEPGRFYGEPGSGTSRVVYSPPQIHAWNHFSHDATASIADYFTQTLGAPTPIPADSQVWWFKEAFTGLGLVGFFLAVFALARITAARLLPAKAGADSRNGGPDAPPVTGRSRVWGIVGLVAIAAFSGASVMPLMDSAKLVFPDATTQNTNGWFDQPATNQIVIWALVNALVGVLVFAITQRLAGNGGWWRRLRESPRRLGAAALVVAFSLGVAYTLVGLVWLLFDTDFRFWVLAVQTPTEQQVLSTLKYLPLFFVYFLFNAVAATLGTRLAERRRWVDTLAVIGGTIGGIVVLIAIQYGVLFSRGEAMWQENLSWLYIFVLFPLVPLLALAVVFARKLYAATGSVYLPAMLNATLLTAVAVINTTTISTV